jgi:hypothetical protein
MVSVRYGLYTYEIVASMALLGMDKRERERERERERGGVEMWRCRMLAGIIGHILELAFLRFVERKRMQSQTFLSVQSGYFGWSWSCSRLSEFRPNSESCVMLQHVGAT